LEANMSRTEGKNKPPVNIEAFKYKDRRTNTPTKELRGFVAEDEAKPKTPFELRCEAG